MHLPTSISNLLRNTIVESDRLELKANWNPEAVLHTLCAFANDFNNFGGGYIVIGIEEENGKPILPPKGIDNEELKDLFALTATVPFDDRLNHHAALEDLKLPLIQSFLKEVNSKLLEESRNVSFADLCRQMALVEGGDEYLKPRNIGLLLFNDQPDKFFPYAQIDVVYFPEGEGGDRIQEEIFKGPLDHQLRSALRHIQNSFITEKILKLPDRAEAQRFFNYPYPAIEEALVNAVYHRSYEIREPIEVRITPECIRIVSYPGADPSIPLKDIQKGHIVTRRYRNRRIGEFLKELDLTEGRGTGIPKIRRVLQANGSPKPLFITDEGRTSFYTEIKIHPEFLKDEAHVEAHVKLSETELKILSICQNEPVGNKEILLALGYKSISGNVKKALKKLKELNALNYTIPEKPRSKNQQYKITEQGQDLLKLR